MVTMQKNEALAGQIRNGLDRYGLSVRQLSARSGVSTETISRMLRMTPVRDGRKHDLFVKRVIGALQFTEAGHPDMDELQKRFEKVASIIREIKPEMWKMYEHIIPTSTVTRMKSGAYIGAENLYRFCVCFPSIGERVKSTLGFYDSTMPSVILRLFHNYKAYSKTTSAKNTQAQLAQRKVMPERPATLQVHLCNVENQTPAQVDSFSESKAKCAWKEDKAADNDYAEFFLRKSISETCIRCMRGAKTALCSLGYDATLLTNGKEFQLAIRKEKLGLLSLNGNPKFNGEAVDVDRLKECLVDIVSKYA